MSQVACDGGVWCGGWGGKGVGGGKWGVWYACVVCRTADGTGLQRDRPAGIAPPSAGERARRKLGGGRGPGEGRREEGTATPRPAGIAPPSAGERARRKLGGGSGRGREEGGGHSDAAARLLGLCQGATLPLPLSSPFFSDGATLLFWTRAEPLALLPLQYYLVVKRTAVISRCLYCRPTPGSIGHDVDLLDVKHQFLCYVESALVDGLRWLIAMISNDLSLSHLLWSCCYKNTIRTVLFSKTDRHCCKPHCKRNYNISIGMLPKPSNQNTFIFNDSV